MLLAKRIIAWCLSVTIALYAPFVEANPQGGVISAGDATISSSASKVDIHQTSDKAVIDWRTFDIAPTEWTDFHQPSAGSFTLNRVNTGGASSINGKLTANGNILIVNQNGVLFGKNANVDVNGLVATTANITNSNFMNGIMKFDQPGNPDAWVSNAGSITAKAAGLVGLVAPHVENSGVINAKLGTVHLASGDTATVDFYGDGLMEVAVSDAVNAQIVSNTGTINAGRIAMTAAAGKSIVNSLISVKGSLNATRVAQKGGDIFIYAAGSNAVSNNVAVAKNKKNGTSKVVVQAKLTATGAKNAKGGAISVLGDDVAIKSGSVLNVSGGTGGGTIKVGGEYQGGGTTPTARTVMVEKGASLLANATGKGNGGNVTLWSDEATGFGGSILAKGGNNGGNGGFIETSSHGVLGLTGSADASAPQGAAGSWLLDPSDVLITSSGNTISSSGGTFNPSTDSYSISASSVAAALNAGNNVTITTTNAGGTQTGSITVSSPILWTTANTLQLQADYDVIVNAAITGSNLTLLADHDFQLNSAITTNAAGTLALRGKTNSTSIGVGNGSTGTIILSDADLANITAGWFQVLIGSSAMTGNIDVQAHTWTSGVGYTTNTGIISINGAQNLGANNLALSSNSDMVINAPLTGTGTLTIRPTANASMGIGDGASGTVNLTEAELNQLTDGWASIALGASSMTSNMDVRAHTWLDNTSFATNTGIITINGAQNASANILTISTNSDIVINAALTGTGSLVFRGGTTASTVDMGIGDGASGTILFSNSDLANITPGWASVTFGHAAYLGNMDVQAHTWTTPTTFTSNTGVITFSGAQNFGANSVTVASNADVAVNAALIGSGQITFSSASNAATIGVGDGATGAFNLSEADLNNIADGWSLLVFGTSAQTAAIDVRAHTWLDPVRVRASTGTITVNGAQNFGSNAASFFSNGTVIFNAAVTGTGTLALRTSNAANGNNMGIGDGASCVFCISEASLNNITDGWNLITIGSTDMTSAMDVRAHTWLDPVTFTANTGVITFNGAQSFGSNAAIISSDGDVAVAANLSGTGTLTFKGAANATTVGIGTGAVGTLSLSAAEIAKIQSGFSSVVFGSTSMTGAMDVRAMTWNNPVTFTSNTGVITVNGAQSFGANTATLSSNADPVISANLTGTGSIIFQGTTASTSMGIGDSSTGTFNLSNAELARIVDGFSSITFGTSTMTGTMDIRAFTWLDPVTFMSNTGLITVNAAQNFNANAATFSSNAAPTFIGTLTGTGTLTIKGTSDSTSIGLGAGTSGVTWTMNGSLSNISSGWGSIVIGSTTMTGAMDIRARSWTSPVSFITDTGVITVNGAQSFAANNATFQTNADPVISAALTGTGTLNFVGTANGTTIGIGTSAVGTLNLSSAEVANITDGWASIVIGSTTGTGAIDVRAATWLDPVSLASDTGVITINGVQSMSANNLSILTKANPVINANITGTGAMTFTAAVGSVSIGLGDGATGALNLDSSELNRLLVTGGLTFNSAGQGMDVCAYSSWAAPITFVSSSGVITFNGAQNFGNKAVIISTDANLALNAALTGTGALAIKQATNSTTIGLGDSATGTLNLTEAELNQLTDGWSSISFGNSGLTGNMDVRAHTWLDPIVFAASSGIITFNGAQNFGANNVVIKDDGNLGINAALTGTGTLTIQTVSAATTMGIGDSSTGTLNLTNAKLNNITDGWSLITFGQSGMTGAMDVRARTWTDSVTFFTNTGGITINGAQSFGANNVTFDTNADIALNSTLTGTGTLTVFPHNQSTTLGLGTGATGTVNLTATELNNITDGWGSLVFGNSSSTAAMDVRAYTWKDNVTFMTSSGVIAFNGAQGFGANNATIQTTSDLSLGATLTGTGTLTISGAGLGLGTASSGAIKLTDTELDNIVDGWSSIVFGSSSTVGAIDVRARTWLDPVTFMTSSGVITFNGAQAFNANNVTIQTDANVSVASTLTGTGTLAFKGTNNATAMGIGDSSSGTLNLTEAELSNIADGWSSIVFGTTTTTGNMDVRAHTWLDPVNFITDTGFITVNAAQNFNANAATFSSNAAPTFIGTLTGTGTLTIKGTSDSTSIGLGAGTSGMTWAINGSLSNISSGWSSIVIGSTTMTGAMDLRARSWTSPVSFITNTGVITVNGAQSFGANNATFQTNADLVLNSTLTGTAQLRVQPVTIGTTMGFGDGAVGTLNLTTAELDNIVDGWATILLGSGGVGGAMDVRAYTWKDAIQFSDTSSGVITFNGAQNFGANNVTILSGGDTQINAALTGTGTLTVLSGVGVTYGLGDGAAGILGFSEAELNNITPGWGSLVFGSTAATGNFDVRAHTWTSPVSFITSTGVIAFNGAQNFGNGAVTISTDANLALNAALTGTGALTIKPSSNSTTMGLGDSAAGTLLLSEAELNNITDGWSSITFGSSTMTAAMDVRAHSWADPITFATLSGNISVNGAQNFAANDVTFQTNADVVVGAALNGTGNLTFRSTNSNSIGIGTGATGVLSLSDTELGNIASTWASLTFGYGGFDAGMDVRAHTWLTPVYFISNTGPITFNGAQNFGANAATIQTNADLVVGANLTGTGTLTIKTGNNGTTIGIGDSSVGTLNLTEAELNRLASWSSIIFGSSTSTAAMDIRAHTWARPVTFTTNTGVINVNGAQAFGANSATFQTNANLTLASTLAGSGTLTITGTTGSNTTLGLGTSAGGLINLSSTEASNILDGWSSIVFASTGTGVMTVQALNWTDPVTFQSSTGSINITGAQGFNANAVNIVSDADLVLSANLTGTGALTIKGNGNATSIGLGNSATGTLNLTDTELAKLVDGFSSITIGSTSMTGAIDVRARSWTDPLTFATNTGVITINGAQSMAANNLTFSTNADIALNAALTGTGTLTFGGAVNGTSIGIGDSAVGTINFTEAELNRLTDGWGSLAFGTGVSTGAMDIRAHNWLDAVTFSTAGAMAVNGAQNFNNNAVILRTDSNLVIAASLTGTNDIVFKGLNNATTMGIGDGQAGTLNLTNAELDYVQDGFRTITFGVNTMTGAMNVGAYTWKDSVNFNTLSGVIAVNGAQNFGANGGTFTTSVDLAFNAALSGTGTLSIQPNTGTTTMGLGDGASGTLSFSEAELNQIQDGFTSINIGRGGNIGTIDMRAHTWLDPLSVTGGGTIAVNGVQNFGANNVGLSPGTGLTFAADLIGTGTLTIANSNVHTSMGFGDGAASSINVSSASLDHLRNFSSVTLGNTGMDGGFDLRAYTWSLPVNFINASVIAVNGAQNFGSNAASFQTNSDMAINAALTGTGALTIKSILAATTMGLGDSASGTINLSEAELNRITDGWGSLTFGSTSATGDMDVRAHTWLDGVSFVNHTGIINFNGAQNFGNNAVSIITDVTPVLAANLSGSGDLTLRGAAAATSMYIGNGGIGTLAFDNAFLSHILDGYNSITFGRSVSNGGTMDVRAHTWTDTVTFATSSGVITFNGAQNFGANTATIISSANPVIGASLSGTGNLLFQGGTSTVTMGLGTGATGVFNLDETELNNIADGFSSIIFGTNGMTAAMDIRAHTWTDPVSFITSAGIISVNGAQNFNANNATFQTSANLGVNAALTGTGTLTIKTNGGGIGLGDGAVATNQLVNAELDNITDGWSQLVFGSADILSVSGILANAYTWRDAVTFNTGAGTLNLNGAQNLGGNNLTILTDRAVNMNGVSNVAAFTLQNITAGTSIGLGTGAAGALTLNTSVLNTLSATSYRFGSANAGTVTLNTPKNFGTSPVIIQSGADIVLNTALASSAAGDAFTLAAGSNFVNNVGSNAFALSGAGRWLVYSTNPSSSTVNNLTSDFRRYSCTYGGSCPTFASTGNGLMYTVTPVVTVTPNQHVTYGDNASSALGAYHVTYSGYNTGDAAQDSVTGSLSGSSDYVTGNNVGSYYIHYGTGTLTSAMGYAFSYADSATGLSVDPKALTVTAAAKTRVYGAADPSFTYSYTGLTNGDTSASFSGGLVRDSGENVGSYDINVGSLTGTGNYTIGTYVPAALSITPASLTVTAAAKTKVYGAVDPSFTYNYTGLVNGDTTASFSGSLGRSAGENVGNYGITVGSLTGTGNYTIGSYVADNLSITAASLTVTAAAKSKVYGAADPSFTYSYTGLVNGDTAASFSGALARNAGENVGSYGITVGSLVGTGNYTISSYVGNNLGITPASLTVTAAAQSKVYGGVDPSFTYNYTGLVNGDTSASFTGALGRNAGENVGSYGITLGSLDTGGNYIIGTYVPALMGVTRAPLTVTANNANRIYGSANPAFTLSYSGLVNGDNGGVFTGYSFNTAPISSDIGTYALNLLGGAASNYAVTRVDGLLNVNKAQLTVAANSAFRAQGAADPAFSASFGGLRNGDNASVVSGLMFASTANNMSSPGIYSILVSGGSASNYDLNYVNGQLVVGLPVPLPSTVTSVSQALVSPHEVFTPSFTSTFAAPGFAQPTSMAVLAPQAPAPGTPILNLLLQMSPAPQWTPQEKDSTDNSTFEPITLPFTTRGKQEKISLWKNRMDGGHLTR